MRLRQLARKLGVQPEKIVNLLAENGHVLENEANSKLTEEQEALALEQWGTPAEPESTMTTEEPVDEVEDTKVVQEEVELGVKEETETEANDVPMEPAGSEHDDTAFEVPFGPPAHTTSQISEEETEVDTESVPTIAEVPKKIQLEPEVNSYPAYEEDESYAEAELIPTEKPQLEGLKVLGKIELPEPKKPEPKAEEESKQTEKPQKDRDRNRRGNRRKGRNGKPRLNPVEYERQKSERAAKKKKAEAAKKLKEKKKEHYLSNVKQKKPSATRVAQEEEMAPLPIIGQSRPQPKAKPIPKGPKKKKGLKKFWAWLNGEYDKF